MHYIVRPENSRLTLWSDPDGFTYEGTISRRGDDQGYVVRLKDGSTPFVVRGIPRRTLANWQSVDARLVAAVNTHLARR